MSTIKDQLRKDPRAKTAIPTKGMDKISKEDKLSQRRQHKEKSKRGTKAAEETVTHLQVAQLRSFWDLNMPIREIQATLGWGAKKIYKIARAYDFPQRSRVRASANDITAGDLERFRKLWVADVPLHEIATMMDWSQRRIQWAKQELKLPDRKAGAKGYQQMKDVVITEEEEKAMIKRQIMEDPEGHSATSAYAEQVVDRNIKALAEEELHRQLAVTENLEKLAWECIDVVGRTKEEIAAFNDEETLLKKTFLIKGASELVHKSLSARRSLLALDQISKEQEVGSLFSIDYMEAAERGGLDARPMKFDKEDIEDIEDWEKV